MSLPDFIAFRIWLENSYGLKTKAAGDAVSRLKRAYKIVPEIGTLASKEALNSVLTKLMENEAFNAAPISSQAGMLRSIKLYSRFKLN